MNRAEWVTEWPVQAVLVAAFITATAQCQEAIKGGTGALKDLELKYKKFNEEIIEASDDSIDNATQEVLSSMMIHDIYTRETIDSLINDQVVSEKDYAWRSRPKCYYVEGDVFVEMLIVRVPYCYEYLGDCVHQVWNRSFEKSMYTFLTAYSLKTFPLMQGPSSSGKHVLVQEVARMLAQNLIDRPITPLTGPDRVIQFLKGKRGYSFQNPILNHMETTKRYFRNQIFFSLDIFVHNFHYYIHHAFWGKMMIDGPGKVQKDQNLTKTQLPPPPN